MKTELPRWKERQGLLSSPQAETSTLNSLGETALSKGYVQDALWYFKKAENSSGLEKIKQLAVSEGDAFLLDALERSSGEISNDVWNKLGYQAFDLGKFRFAKRAFERTDNELMLAKIRATLGEPEPASDAADDSKSG